MYRWWKIAHYPNIIDIGNFVNWKLQNVTRFYNIFIYNINIKREIDNLLYAITWLPWVSWLISYKMTPHMSLCVTFYYSVSEFEFSGFWRPPPKKSVIIFSTFKKFARLSTLGDFTRTHRTQKYQPIFYSSWLRV